jgi:uracil-DNA glycosylase
VLLLNTSLTVEAGKANSHRKAGWQELAAEVMAFLNTAARSCGVHVVGQPGTRGRKGD